MIELYAGSAGISRAMADVGFKVGPPIEIKSGWDMANAEVFGLLVRLCAAGRVGLLWLGPPCTTYSLVRFPKLRSKLYFWGFDPLEPETCWGNLHLRQALALFLVQSSAGNEAVAETPWGAFSRHLPWWRALASCSTEVRVDQCRFGVPYMKPTSLLCTSKAFAPLQRRCNCKTPRERLEGAATSRAAEYPQLLCQEVARISVSVAKLRMFATQESHELGTQRNSEPGELRDHRGAQRFVSHLWAAHLAESLPWKTIRAYKFQHPNHINILEAHAHKTLMQIAPRDCRLVVLQDSMVTLGATAKGRSSSEPLNKVLRQSMSLQLAKNIYPRGVHCPTWALRADDPSRSRSVTPARAALPAWFLALRTGRLEEAQDAIDDCSGTPRSWNRWLLFASAALLSADGDPEPGIAETWKETELQQSLQNFVPSSSQIFSNG